MSKEYIPRIPGNIKRPNDTRTNILAMLGYTGSPLTEMEGYNDNGPSTPVATIQIDGQEYDLADVAKFVGDGLIRDTVKTDAGTILPVYPTPASTLALSGTVMSDQAGTGDPTPANQRDISGHATLSVLQSGKNLFRFPYAETTKTSQGVTFTVAANGSITLSGTSTSEAYFGILLNTGKQHMPKGKYILSGCPATAQGAYLTFVGETTVSDTGNGAAVDLPKATDVYAYIVAPTGTTFSGVVFWPQLELGTVLTAYEFPVTVETTITPDEPLYGMATLPDTYSISAAGTVSLVHNTGAFTFDGTEEGWLDTHFSASGYFEIEVEDNKSSTRNLLCDYFLPAATAEADSNKILFYENMLLVYPSNDVATSKAEWLAWLVTNGLKIVAELDTPTTENATALISPTTGLNVIFDDGSGAFSVTYTKYIIQEFSDIRTEITSFRPWENKVWAAIGDSLTANNWTTPINYTRKVSDALRLDVRNHGYSGAGYMALNATSHAFYDHAALLDPDVDVVTIFGSGNDMADIASLGLADDDFDTEALTICGCINHTIDVIQGLLPSAPIGIIAPAPWEAYPTTTAGNNMELYTDKLEAICKLRGIPYLDLYHASNLRPWDADNKALFFLADGLHLNALGHEIIAARIREFIRSLV